MFYFSSKALNISVQFCQACLWRIIVEMISPISREHLKSYTISYLLTFQISAPADRRLCTSLGFGPRASSPRKLCVTVCGNGPVSGVAVRAARSEFGDPSHSAAPVFARSPAARPDVRPPPPRCRRRRPSVTGLRPGTRCGPRVAPEGHACAALVFLPPRPPGQAGWDGRSRPGGGSPGGQTAAVPP